MIRTAAFLLFKNFMEGEGASSSERVSRRVADKGGQDKAKEGTVGVADIEETVVRPVNWEQVVENIRTMRGSFPAPVDTMGCERTMDESADPKVRRFQALVSLLLSSQTKDEITYATMGRLKGYGLTPEKMLEIGEAELKEMLKPVSFFNNKAKFLQKCAKICLEDFAGDIPDTAEGLMKLPGIGPKMAFICMQVAWDKNSGIGVDTHVHRISERLGWTTRRGKTHTPEDTRKQLEAWLPKSLWQEVNILLVGFGQTVCAARTPKCSECLNQPICPFGKKNVKSKKAKTEPAV